MNKMGENAVVAASVSSLVNNVYDKNGATRKWAEKINIYSYYDKRRKRVLFEFRK